MFINLWKKCEIVLFPTAVFKWLEDVFFIGAKNTDDLTFNNFTLCRGEGIHDPNMPFGKRRYVPRGSHPWKFPPKKVGPVVRLDVYVFHRFFYEGKNNSIESQVSEEKKPLTKISSEVSAKSGKFYDKFPPFSRADFFPNGLGGSLEASPFFVLGFLLRLQAAEAEPEEAGVWWVLLRVKSRVPWKAGYRVDPDRGRGMEEPWKKWVSWLSFESNRRIEIAFPTCFLLVGGGNSNISDFHPDLWGNDPIWRSYFSNGLVQPPTSCWLRFRIPAFCFEIVQRLNALPVEKNPWNLGKL